MVGLHRRGLDLRQRRLEGSRISASFCQYHGSRGILTSGGHGSVLGVCGGFWLFVEILNVGMEVEIRFVASGFRMQLADFGFVHDLYVRQVL